MVVRIAILVAVAIFIGETAWSTKREQERVGREQARDQREIARDVHADELERAAVAKRGPLSYRASTNAVAAQVTLTNLDQTEVRYACVKGSVERKGTSKTTETVEVCSGDLKPHSTVTLVAPYVVGAVEDLCSTTKQTYFGERKELDWDLCTFDVNAVELTAPAAKKATL